jgi:hypothetical protein
MKAGRVKRRSLLVPQPHKLLKLTLGAGDDSDCGTVFEGHLTIGFLYQVNHDFELTLIGDASDSHVFF